VQLLLNVSTAVNVATLGGINGMFEVQGYDDVRAVTTDLMYASKTMISCRR